MQYAYATVIFEEPDLLHFMMISDDIVVFFHSKLKKKRKKAKHNIAQNKSVVFMLMKD